MWPSYNIHFACSFSSKTWTQWLGKWNHIQLIIVFLNWFERTLAIYLVNTGERMVSYTYYLSSTFCSLFETRENSLYITLRTITRRNFLYLASGWSFPCSSVAKESGCNAGDPGSIPGSGRSLGGNGNALQYSCLENPMGRGTRQATVYGVTRVGHDWTTKHIQQRRFINVYWEKMND